MARGESHFLYFRHIPCAHYHSAAVWGGFDLLQHIADLVYGAAVVIRPRTPLMTVDWAQLAILVCPFIPYAHTVLLQVFDVGVALQKPSSFVYDGFQVQLFCRQQRETF